jgi:hypothetical protein
MVDELALNWVVSLASCGIIYGGCRLSGSFVYFWLMLTTTLSNGIGEQLTMAGHRYPISLTMAKST